MRPLSIVMCVCALSVTAGVGAARAQTVIVTNAPAGSTIELQLNAEAARSTTADSNGDATMAVGLPRGLDETDVRFVVDLCGPVVRLHLVNPGVQPPPAAAPCNRNAIPSLFVMRSVTTFVVDLAGSNVSIHLTQGPAPRTWLAHGTLAEQGRRSFQAAPPAGLMLFAAAGLGTFRNAVATTCGNLTTCTGGNSAGAGAAGVAYWINRFFGGEITFGKRTTATANGNGEMFRFDSTLDARVITIAGMVGAPVGPVRMYGLAGRNRHHASFTTTETIDDATVVVDGVTQTIKGGTQVFDHTTEAWQWLFGGGVETWVNKAFAFYVEVQRARFKATDIGATEGGIDDHLMLIVVGARVRLGR
jgi:hypothetical protein